MSTQKIVNIYKPKLTRKKKVYCSPNHRKNKYTCFTKPALVKIVKSWNSKNNENKIELRSKSRIKDIWNAINEKLKKKCYGEWCWVQQDFVKSLSDDDINNTFRPNNPKDWCQSKNEWLSTVDIENVMQQYEDKYPNFYFIGPVPIDFDDEYSMGSCIVDELCKIDLQKLKRKKIYHIGIVFNLDKHNQSGSHWVAMFVDLKRKGIYYWDSYAEKPPKEVDVLATRLQKQGKKMKLKLEYQKNNVRHQFQNSECGVYCMYFITKLLQGKSFNEVINHKIDDKDMMAKRGYFYSPNCSQESE